MSKVTRYFCDVCGCELDEEKDLIELDLFDYFLHRNEGSVTVEADLCDNCLSDLEEDLSRLIIERTSVNHGRYRKI